jgi:hypothetical protein
MEYNTVGLMLRTLRCRLLGIPDIARWRNTEAFDDWKDRTLLIAQLVPRGTRVIEFGAGKRNLESHLDSRCTYIPSDLVSRGPNTLVLDLNTRPLPDLRELKLDVAVLAGVIEYISAPRSFVAWLAQQVKTCIASYECARTRPKTLGRVRETVRRTGAGWVSTLTEGELTEIFCSAGFTLTETRDWHTMAGSERIFVFRSSGIAVPKALQASATEARLSARR